MLQFHLPEEPVFAFFLRKNDREMLFKLFTEGLSCETRLAQFISHFSSAERRHLEDCLQPATHRGRDLFLAALDKVLDLHHRNLHMISTEDLLIECKERLHCDAAR